MIDTRFCATIGTEKQHKYACFLASKAGFSALRYALAAFSGRSVSKCQKVVVTVKEASEFIDWLKEKSNS
jgi:hypothetical protein